MEIFYSLDRESSKIGRSQAFLYTKSRLSLEGFLRNMFAKGENLVNRVKSHLKTKNNILSKIMVKTGNFKKKQFVPYF